MGWKLSLSMSKLVLINVTSSVESYFVLKLCILYDIDYE